DWLARACEKEPNNPVARFHRGEVLYNRGLTELALVALKEAVASNPEYAEAHYLLAFVYGDLGQHEAARAASKRALSLNPMLGRAQANLALARGEAAKRGSGEAAANGQVRVDASQLRLDAASSPPGVPTSPQSVPGALLAHYNLGLALRQKGYYEESLREYQLGLEAGEDRRLNLQAMAEVHLLRRDLNAALQLYDLLVKDYPDSPKLWNERGVCLHQSGHTAAAASSYEKAVEVDPAYQLAWNNLGVLRSSATSPDASSAAFRRALSGSQPLLTARLNLGLLFLQRNQLKSALEEYQRALTEQPASAVGWNGLGLVLVELRRYEDARNAFGRAIDVSSEFAAAHYNLSFVLSQLGDFDGALRETKRALELEPMYIPQKFSLTIDLQYEDPTIAIAPELVADVSGDELGGEFSFDPPALDQLFTELAPATPSAPAAPAEESLKGARELIAKGLLDLASNELTRASARGAAAGPTAVLLGEIFAKRGLYGEALERFRQARTALPRDRDAALGEIKALLALNRAEEAAGLADDLAAWQQADVEVLAARARVRLSLGDARGAVESVKQAQALAPSRPELYQLRAQASARLGDRAAALADFQTALELDPSLVRVWHELGALEEERHNWL
ncbi:MAG TPA: tetratricopeptide repeat protein, partial [Gemmatimonadales bacterium]|nr:tetratricopeptide repeat protein [Gemmatimonadales bacterium]